MSLRVLFPYFEDPATVLGVLSEIDTIVEEKLAEALKPYMWDPESKALTHYRQNNGEPDANVMAWMIGVKKDDATVTQHELTDLACIFDTATHRRFIAVMGDKVVKWSGKQNGKSDDGLPKFEDVSSQTYNLKDEWARLIKEIF